MTKKIISETETEWLFKDLLEKKGYLNNDDIIVEFKDATSDMRVKKLLKNASKSGSRQGIPDFILRTTKYPEIVFLVECKADIKYHESLNRDKYNNYAVDGVLWYSSFVSKEYDVLSIALSGTENHYKISAFKQLQGTTEVEEVKSKELLTYDNYLRLIIESEEVFNRDYSKLLSYANELNNDLHKKKIKESYRALLISGVLVALQDEAFRMSYKKHRTPTSLITSLLNSISSQLRSDPKKDKNTDIVLGAFDFIKTTKTFSNSKTGLLALNEVIDSIKENVYTFLDKYKYVDTLSQFYIEFLRYANTDKGLGIVLTPMHIAQLFAKMANVRKNSIVLDNAAGTGGFLVAAMGEMMIDAGDDENNINTIREKQIYGIEYDSNNLALLASNMIIHSDGRSNIMWGDTFDIVPSRLKKDKIIDVGLLNPPFKMAKDDVYEFDFIFSNLDALKEKGTLVALVPASVVTDITGENYEYKKRLLENHTLEAVTSLPEELFSNSKTSVVTVAIVITAHIPHPKNKETWFGYWRDDGFVKTRNLGRTDLYNVWSGENGLEEKWLYSFSNRKEIPEFSVNKKVSAEDEWIAEAYLETDYLNLKSSDFEQQVREYFAFKLVSGKLDNDKDAFESILSLQKEVLLKKDHIHHQSREEYKKIEDIFYVHNGYASSNVTVFPDKINKKYIPYVRPSKLQSGSYAGYVDTEVDQVPQDKIFDKDTLYISTDGAGSHTYSYVAIEKIIPNSNVIALIPKQKMTLAEKMFYATIITANRFKFSYGRKPKGDRIKSILIPDIQKK